MADHWRTSRPDFRGAEHLAGSPFAAECDDPSILIPTCAPFERGQISQALLDVGAVLVWMFFGLLGAAVVGGPVIVLMWFLLFR